MGSSVSGGSVMIAIAQGGTIPTGATVSDNINAGNYATLASYSAGNLAIYWKVMQAGGGTPTVTLATPGGYSYITICAVTGFAGTPTADAGIVATATGTSATAAINAASNFNNEIMLVGFYEANNYANAITVSGWTPVASSGGTQQPGFYSIEAVPTTNNFSGTLTSQQWWLLLGGIYDLGAPPPPVAPYGPMPKQIYIMP
jgi:hypothetical protein